MKKVMILNPYVHTLGGGEKHMGYVCKCIEEYYNGDVKIEIVVFNVGNIHDYDKAPVTIDMVNKQFGIDLKHTEIVKIDFRKPGNKLEFLKEKEKIENMTRDYDIFINFKFLSKDEGHAKINIYECMFPPKTFESEMQKNIFERMIGRHYDRRFAKSYAAFFCNSQFNKKWTKKYWGKYNKNLDVAYPPVFSQKEIENRYEESEKKNIILSVGRFFMAGHCKKQREMVQFFINNIDSLKDFEYHLAGAVSEETKEDVAYVEEIEAMAAKYPNIHIHKNCPYEELMDLYRHAKVFWHGTGYQEDESVAPERMEHFGITTVEAMSYGVVPVVINKGGQPETVDVNVNGYLWDNEKECVENTLKLKDDALRKKMAENAVLKARKYSTEEFCKRHFELFKKVGM